MNTTIEDLLLIIGEKEVTLNLLRRQLQEMIKKVAELEQQVKDK